jgi:HMG-box domain
MKAHKLRLRSPNFPIGKKPFDGGVNLLGMALHHVGPEHRACFSQPHLVLSNSVASSLTSSALHPRTLQQSNMEKLSMILEEAQSIVADDSYCFDNNHHANSFACSNTVPTPLEAFSLEFCTKASAHKALKAPKKRTWKKPVDKPKRPLSAYNLFFKEERERILASISDDKATVDLNDGLTEEIRRRRHRKTHGKIGFADLARSIADQWKSIDANSRSTFESQADIEKTRYKKELEAWMKGRKEKEDRTVKKSKPALIQSVPQQSLSGMMSASSIRNQLLHQQLMMQHQALMSQQQQMETLMGLPDMIQQQQRHIMLMNQQRHVSFSMPTLPPMLQGSAGVPQSVEIPTTGEDHLFAPDMSYSSNNFFDYDHEPLPMEHQSVVTEESDLSSLEDDLTNFMNDFEAEL